MIASLAMYDRPETQEANDALWRNIRVALGFGPDRLTRDTTLWDIWTDPALVLAQTCGLPYRARLHDKVSLVGTPVYDIADCPDGFYYSVIVTRKDTGISTIKALEGKRMAYNEALSQSGWAAPSALLSAQGVAPSMYIETGSHRASAKAVAEGAADFAALDVVSWTLMQRHDGFAPALDVIAKTPPTPGLPLISARKEDLFTAVAAAIDALSAPQKEILMLSSITRIAKTDYLALPNPAPPPASRPL